MDALLRYTLYRIAFSLLLIELVLMLMCCLLIVIIKFYTKHKRKNREKEQSEIRSILDTYLLENKSLETLHIPKKIGSFQNIVESLETYDHLFTDVRWQEIKEKIVLNNLMPTIPRYAGSIFWFKRQLAARALLLNPKSAPKKIVESLLDDRRFLVRVAAATCITLMSDKPLFEKAIQKMSHESPGSQFPYRDALIQVNEEKYHWIENMLTTTTDPKIQAICLDVLATRYSGTLFPVIKPFVTSPDIQCRTLAIKALGNIPTLESKEILIHRLDDSNWTIRAEAIMSLQKLHATEAIPNLQEALNDPIWWVRLQAALTLKGLGHDGLKILNVKRLEKDSNAHEIAQYALAIP